MNSNTSAAHKSIENTSLRLHIGDCLEVLKGYPDNSFDSVVTDPPYGISFMSCKWDYGVPSIETWVEVLRVLKPGGHIAAFGGTRTYHRIACAIEDAGFEIRDGVHWLFGSGFPKSKQVSVAIGKHFGFGSQQTHVDVPITKATSTEAQKYDGFGTALKPAHEPICLARKPLIGTLAENYLAHGTGGINIDGCRVQGESYVINRYTDGAKPFGGGSGHPHVSIRAGELSAERTYADRGDTNFSAMPGPRGGAIEGRWPANVVHDGSPEVMAVFPRAPGQQGKVSGSEPSSQTSVVYGELQRVASCEQLSDQGGSAARYFNSFPYSEEDAQSFFYNPKAGRKEREAGLESMPARTGAEAVKRKEGTAGLNNPRAGAGRRLREVRNHHPTVKPIALMRWLCRLITPPGGTVLDPFMGSGSTGIAAVEEKFGFIGIDNDAEYVNIARHRIAMAV